MRKLFRREGPHRPSPRRQAITLMQSLPAYLSPHETAFFFDFDGTLVELAPTPDSIVVPPSLVDLLDELRRLSNGAVAIVSGRGIDSIDAFLAMPDLPVAGLHGAERRDANGDTQRIGFHDERLLRMERVLEEVVQANPGMLLEIKGAALALHYRNAPEREAAARRATERLVADYSGAYVLQPGKMVYEIKPKDVDKGRALRAFLDEPPFAGRTPLFAGDDLTDEKGFAAVNERGGLSIKVGAGDTMARLRVESVEALHRWLSSIVAAARIAS
jgi:trehalose 6-phosphate phosphatase